MHASEKGRIGDLEIKNRIVMAPMISNLANPDGSTNENHTAYLEERARGGAGIIITEYTYVDPVRGRGSRNQLGLYSPDQVPKLRRLTSRIHSHGAKVFIQLVHAGGKALYGKNGEEPMAPSAVQFPGRVPREMTKDDIRGVVNAFIQAAKYAKEAHFDGIELHGAHGYLLQEFMSPGLNKRKDEYGGSLENNLRITQEIIDGIRAEVDIVVGIRLSLYEDDEDGYDAEYGLKIAETLKGLDYVHFSAGRIAPPGSSSSFYDGRTHILKRLSRKPDLATMVVGSVISEKDVADVLGKADFVAVARGMLADSHFAEKVINDPASLRPCIRCNQACRDLSTGEVGCSVNPETGLENYWPRNLRGSGDITIVGAGLKGLEAALTAAKAGFSVRIVEKRNDIGGQLLDITDERKKEEFLPILNYYREALGRLNVKIETGKEYSGDGIYCLPDTTYPALDENGEVSIDSNVFMYHDMALKLAESHEVYLSERSLLSLDRARKMRFMEMAEKAGIQVVDHESREFSISEFHRDQYDMLAAMKSGRNAVIDYIGKMGNRNL